MTDAQTMDSVSEGIPDVLQAELATLRLTEATLKRSVAEQNHRLEEKRANIGKERGDGTEKGERRQRLLQLEKAVHEREKERCLKEVNDIEAVIENLRTRLETLPLISPLFDEELSRGPAEASLVVPPQAAKKDDDPRTSAFEIDSDTEDHHDDNDHVVDVSDDDFEKISIGARTPVETCEQLQYTCSEPAVEPLVSAVIARIRKDSPALLSYRGRTEASFHSSLGRSLVIRRHSACSRDSGYSEGSFIPGRPPSSLFPSRTSSNASAARVRARDSGYSDGAFFSTRLSCSSGIPSRNSSNASATHIRTHGIGRNGSGRKASKHSGRHDCSMRGFSTTDGRPPKKRQRDNGRDSDPESGSSDDSDDEGRRRGSGGLPKDTAPKRKLKCPYYQKMPWIYTRNACRGMGFADMAKLKDHLKRVHLRPPQCSRCGEDMASEEIYNAHLRKEPVCKLQEDAEHDNRLTSQQLLALNFNKKPFAQAASVEEKWGILFKMIFKDAEEIPSPYEEIGLGMNSQFDEAFASNFCDELARELPDLLQYFPGIQEKLPAIIRKSKEKALSPGPSGATPSSMTTSRHESTVNETPGSSEAGPSTSFDTAQACNYNPHPSPDLPTISTFHEPLANPSQTLNISPQTDHSQQQTTFFPDPTTLSSYAPFFNPTPQSNHEVMYMNPSASHNDSIFSKYTHVDSIYSHPSTSYPSTATCTPLSIHNPSSTSLAASQTSSRRTIRRRQPVQHLSGVFQKETVALAPIEEGVGAEKKVGGQGQGQGAGARGFATRGLGEGWESASGGSTEWSREYWAPYLDPEWEV
ncbi:hypothetical protein EJ04DRAFT_578513 [Polyplosphaeria fusca]|uniref:C2H2-type domain-containing protein n=1 Tax=Polyplosphaeria fusca TaxID=682080 RepID=A0A9P4QWL8_9PLEO|nr:hypothetical protein EJ04DRAFT_578513 [Polyplosphaeria fusca]